MKKKEGLTMNRSIRLVSIIGIILALITAISFDYKVIVMTNQVGNRLRVGFNSSIVTSEGYNHVGNKQKHFIMS